MLHFNVRKTTNIMMKNSEKIVENGRILIKNQKKHKKTCYILQIWTLIYRKIKLSMIFILILSAP